jgi:hypothetical protein
MRLKKPFGSEHRVCFHFFWYRESGLMVREVIAGVCVSIAVASANPAAQTAGPAAQPAGRGAASTRKPAPPATASIRIAVRDQDGTALSGVQLLLSGANSGEFTTGPAGTVVVPNIKTGLNRVRCEREGFITLEREFNLGGGAWNPIDIVLSPAPPPPPPPPAPEPKIVAVSPSNAPPVTVSIPDFLDKNLIRREPLKESILACTPYETVRVLQMREGVATHAHDGLDEVIYVVAGEGAVRIGSETTAVGPGSLVVVPSGNGHAFERRGKNPLIVVSTLAGSACKTVATAP